MARNKNHRPDGKPEKIYLFECKNGQFTKKEYGIKGFRLFGGQYDLVGADGRESTCSASWLEVPRAASLWTADPDPGRAYNVLLTSAQKDLQSAADRMKVFAAVLDRIMDADPEAKSAPEQPEKDAPISRCRILVAGRTQTGKTQLAKLLSERTGLPVLKTSTTRPKRTPDEDCYHFYSESEAEQIPDSQKLFLTHALDGHARWTDRDDFLGAGIAILDPTGLGGAVKLWQETGDRVAIVYVSSGITDRWCRFMRSVQKTHEEAVQDFCERESIEGPMFTAFETEALKASVSGTTMHGAQFLEILDNDGETPLESMAERICSKLGYAGAPQGAKREIILKKSEYDPENWALVCKALAVRGIDASDVTQIVIPDPDIKISTSGARF